MKDNKNVYEKISPVSIRLSADGRERLNRLQKKSGCKSQKEFIETLMQLYETSGMQKLADETISTEKLILQNNNWITEHEDKKYQEPEVLEFNGVCIYAPQQPNKMIKLSTLPSETVESIKMDYYLPDEMDIERYLIQDIINVYYSYTNKKYIIIEYFYIFQHLDENEILDMYKEINGVKVNGLEVGNTLVCKYNKYEVSNFSDFVSLKKSYMSTSDIINIDFFIKKHRLNTEKND